MRKNISNLVGTIMLSTPHWTRKNRLHSLLLLIFSVMLIMSSATQFVQIASATASSGQLETESDCEAASVQVSSACESGPAYEIEKCIKDVNCMGSQASVKEAGDVITYLIAVTNTGDVELTNLTVTDPLIEPLAGPAESKDTDGVLDVGETWTYTGSYTVTQEDINTNGDCDGYIDNVAMVDCDQLEAKCDSARVPIEEASSGDDSTADNSTADNSTADNSTEDNSTEDNSTEDNSTADNSTADNSTEDNSTEDNSTAGNSTAGNSTEDNSTAGNSTEDNLAEIDSSSDASTFHHHSDGGTGEARIIPKPTKNVEVNETGNETQLGPEVRNFDQNTESVEADLEGEPEQEKASLPGFEIAYGAVGLLAATFLYKRK